MRKINIDFIHVNDLKMDYHDYDNPIYPSLINISLFLNSNYDHSSMYIAFPLKLNPIIRITP